MNPSWVYMQNNKKMKVLCIFSRLLGGESFTTHVVEVINENKDIVPTYIFIDKDDYLKYPAPPFMRLSCTLETMWVMKKKYSNVLKEEKFDMIFVQGFELILGVLKMIKKIPTAVFLDTTPILSHKLIVQAAASKIEGARSRFAAHIFIHIFRKAFRRVDVFAPRTSWCADSLVNDFNVGQEKIHITCGFQDLSTWRPIEKEKNKKRSLLFVGNDFKGKGGDFLLDLYQKYLSKKCLLSIVSNDTCLLDMPRVEGVDIINGLSHKNIPKLISLYQNADIFIFPTRVDKLGLVLTEAVSVGLPVVASDTGGVKELVRDGYNGFLMPYNSSVKDWAENIIKLCNDEDMIDKFSQNSRRLAEEKLRKKDFEKLIEKIIVELTCIEKRSLVKGKQ